MVIRVLGIETSCDETSVCVLKGRGVLALQTLSQIDLHSEYGGVVPEISARSHITVIRSLAIICIEKAGLRFEDIDVIAVTNRPGLIGGLIVGVNYAKGLAMFLGKPIVYVNHLEGHIFTAGLTHGLDGGFYGVLVSGGHSQTIEVESLKDYRIVGRSLDDSVGEGFDKLSKSLGLGYPGGPVVEKMALKGDVGRFGFNFGMGRRDRFNFSFSGLKTHFMRISKSILEEAGLSVSRGGVGFVADGDFVEKVTGNSDVWDLCASFQRAVTDILLDRAVNLIESGGVRYSKLVLCGGVAANEYIRERFRSRLLEMGVEVVLVPIKYCTDNAAMIANVGRMYAELGEFSNLNDPPASKL